MIGVAAMIPFLPTDNPPDPRFPNPMIGWCPGGGAGGLTGYGFCDGVRYPDGSYWHIIRGDVPFVGSQMRMDCVVMVPITRFHSSPRAEAAGAPSNEGPSPSRCSAHDFPTPEYPSRSTAHGSCHRCVSHLNSSSAIAAAATLAIGCADCTSRSLLTVVFASESSDSTVTASPVYAMLYSRICELWL